MLKHLVNTKRLRTAIFAVGIAMLAAVVSIPSGGAKSKSLTKSELKNLIANAKTPSDHERIAEYFDAEAAKYQAEAKEHDEEGDYYAKHAAFPLNKAESQNLYAHDMPSHCRELAAKLREAAHEAHQLATVHREIAKATN